ncbi:tetraspanin-18-like [Saccoglossus kowalevskii]|uniref:Tetraspanin n=1 Tax=Saccoglossus kowalevskii TaxID=10224 RepID=A0ABM0GZ69_SACKO|nr:PREDICTED: tetraspanin-11-like [Saccoglossus kowalevskii]
MESEKTPKCIKYMLFLLNFIFWLCGMAMVALGVWILLDFPAYLEVLDNAFLQSAVYLLIGVGAVVTVVAFLGCCGAIMEKKAMLIMYTCLVMLMLLAEIALAGMIFYFGLSDIEAHILEAANSTLVMYGEQKAVTDSWDTIQRLGKCCGINGPDDYEYTAWANEHIDQGFPDSCCTTESLESAKYINLTLCHDENPDYFNGEGCVTALKDFVTNNVYIAAGIAVGVAALQLIGVIAGYCLCCAIE